MKTNFNFKNLQCLTALIIFLTFGVKLQAAVSDTTVISAPSNLTATAFTNTSVDLHWTDNSNDEAGFKIEYKKGNENTWTAGGQTAQNITIFRVLSLQPNTLYNFRVNAFNGSMSSTYSNTASAFTNTDSSFGTPNAPSNLSVSFLSAYKGRLHWTDNSGNESGFIIDYKKSSDSAWGNHLQAGQNQTDRDASGLQSGTTYNFRVRAFNSSGYSGYSNTATGTTPWDSIINSVPNAPSGLTATAFGSRIVRLAWNDNSNNETGFKIERRMADSTSAWTLIATLGNNRNTFGDSNNVMPNTNYNYRIYAFNLSGNSAYSNTASVRTTSGNVLNPVTPNGTTPLLSWNVIPGVVNYKVTIALDANFDAIVFDAANISVTQYQVTSNTLSPSMSYYYRVIGYTSNNVEAGSDFSTLQTSATGIIHYNSEMPLGYSLRQNYPNPFNPTTTIKFDIVKSDFVKIQVFNSLGSKIDELVNGTLKAGSYSVEWNASKQSSGVYFYRIITTDFTKTMKMSLVK